MHKHLADSSISIGRQGGGYRADIDGLRALAVISVVLYHAFPSLLPGGFIGVDIFFVISGYLISGHIVQGMSKGQFSLARFYERRIRRIFPALILVLSACLAFGWFALMANEYEQLGKHAAAGAGFIANLSLWQEIGYFDNSGITKPLLHLWSLGIEEQFYIVWPVLVWAGWKLRANMLALILIAAFLSWSSNLSAVGPDESAAFYSPQTRFWELLIGAALAEIERRGISPRVHANVLSVTGCALLALGPLYINEAQAFPGMLAAVPTVGAALVIAAGPGSVLSRYVFSNRLAVGVGLISYPLYLWHWPLLSFAYIIECGTPDRVIRFVLVGVAIAAATATYFFVERPIRFGRLRSAPLTLPLLVGMLAVGGSGYWIFANAGVQSRPAVQDTLKVSSQFVGSMWAYTQNENCTTRHPFEESEEYGWWFCMLEKPEVPTVLITGGSFANQLYPGLANNPQLSKQNFLSIGTCAPLHIKGENGPASTNPCSGPFWANQNRFIEEILEREPTIKTVIVAGVSAVAADDPTYFSDLIRRIADVSASGAQVIVFSPHIQRDIDVRICFTRPFAEPKLGCEITNDQYSALLRENATLERNLKERAPHILFFEQNQAFCEDGKCSLVQDGTPLIRDEYYHISEFGSRRVAESFVQWAKDHHPRLLD